MKDLNEFLNEELNERNIQVKRKYGIYDSINVGKNAPIRNSILGFINEKGCCSKDEMCEFIKSKNEESGANTSMKWLTKNAKYIKKTTNENGDPAYKLSKLGARVIKKTNISE